MRNTPTRLNGTYDEIAGWDAPSGASLCVYHKKAEGKPKAAVHINHGLGEHAGRYGRFAEALSDAGYEVYAQDHRGHGATTAPEAAQGVFAEKDGWDKVLADMKFVNDEIHKRHPGEPVVLFGHSMGAMLAYNYLLRWPQTVVAAAIWNADLSKNPLLPIMKTILAIEILTKGPEAESLVTKLTFEAFNKKFKPNQTGFDWLSKDVDECRAYENDPDCGWPPSVSLWKDLASGVAYGARDKGIENIPRDLPVYLLGGDADPSTRNAKATEDLAKRLKAAGLINVKTTIRKDGRHEALNEPEAERNAVTAEFIDWLKEAV